jgi:hypothetical protein
MPMFAHIAGIPVEETALSFGPVVGVVGGFAVMRLRAGLRRRSPKQARRRIESR